MTNDPRTPEDPLIGADAVPPPQPPVYEPADSLSPTRVGMVGESGTLGAAATVTPRRGRPGARWLLALAGVIVVAVGTFLIVSLAGGRPTTSPALGYMPPTMYSYSEVRFDLPGDQRQKVAAFLANFPGFKDQTQIDVKLTDILDRIVKAATDDKQSWSTDIKPWFGGQVAFGMGLPDANGPLVAMSGMGDALFVVTITDRAKAVDWIVRTAADATLNRTTYGNADLFTTGSGTSEVAIAVTDKVMLGGTTATVKAAVDSNGNATFSQDSDVKAALATIDKDYVALSVIRTRAYLGELAKLAAGLQPGLLEKTQIDETIIAMVPPWQVMTARFENDAIVSDSLSPSYAIGHDAQNRASQVLGHVPAKTIFYVDVHDVGPTLKAVFDKFRALPETKPVFDQVDQALSLLGGFDAVFGWWGDAAIVVSPLADGTIGGGLVIKARDAAAAERLATTLSGFLVLVGGQAGVATRTEDYNGTKITIVDVSGAPGMSTAGLPPGYKAELAWATNADISVIGYGATFVKEVLDAGPGKSLADDARFKALVDRVGGAENISVGFVDIAGIRAMVEPLLGQALPPQQMATYTTEIKPYLEHLDAMIQAVRKDNGVDRSGAAITVR